MQRCHRCNSNRLWKLRSGKLRCAVCKTSFLPRTGGVYIPSKILKNVITEFDLEHSTNVILERCVISKYKLLKLLTALRTEMTKEILKAFSGIVEVDETYVGGKWKNKRLTTRKFAGKQKRGRGTLKQPVFGILCRDGEVWAELVDGVEAEDLQPLIQNESGAVQRSVQTAGARTPGLPRRGMCIVWLTTVRSITRPSAADTSTAWKDSGDT